MSKFNQDKINSIFLRMPDLRYLINQSFRKVTGICPFQIVRGITNAAETGYQPMGAQPRDYTDFERVLDGRDPVVVDWEDSVTFPFDGTLNQRVRKAPSIKIRGEGNSFTEEREKIDILGSVFRYEGAYDIGEEFELPKLKNETETEYQVRFQKELGKELDRLALPENKKADIWGREYYEQLHTKNIVKKYGKLFRIHRNKCLMKVYLICLSLHSLQVIKRHYHFEIVNF